MHYTLAQLVAAMRNNDKSHCAEAVYSFPIVLNPMWNNQLPDAAIVRA